MESLLKNIRNKHSIILLFLHSLIGLSACQQVTLVIKDIPANTPPGAAIFVTGNFNYWDPGDRTYALKLNTTDSTYSVRLPKGLGSLEYRFTRGDWTTTETDICGNALNNRQLRYRSSDTVYADVQSWKDLGPVRCNQATVVLDKLPSSTPADAALYIAGSFNEWKAADTRYRLKKNAAGKYYAQLPPNLGEIEFKFTRGSWDNDEVDAVGNPLPNRTLSYGRQDTVAVEILNWKDRIPPARYNDRVAVVVKIPKTTPPNERVFVTGNFNNWNPHDPNFELRPLDKYIYTLNLPRRRKYIEFKFTRGDWATVEADKFGKPTENRRFTYGHLDTLRLEIQRWEDLR